ncbi:MAG TPA: BA14K family protein [Rhizobiales bacterium]|nr:BA14K family protein [Hyphomicrobiales bacterium]
MNRFFRTTVLSAAVLATTLATLPVEARDRYGRHEPHHERTGSDADLVAAGILGLAVGAIVMGALAQPEPKGPVYRGDPLDDPSYFPPAPRPVGGGDVSLEPWSDAWFDYCEARYRSFDPDTGTFTGHDGRRRFCIAG